MTTQAQLEQLLIRHADQLNRVAEVGKDRDKQLLALANIVHDHLLQQTKLTAIIVSLQDTVIQLKKDHDALERQLIHRNR